jgi:hypothetical protein
MQWCGDILCRYKLCSGVAAYYVKSILVCMQCLVQNETELILAIVTLARLKHEPPDDGHRPNSVGAF